MHFVLPSPSVQKPAAPTFISHQNVPKPGMVLSSHAGHKLGSASQFFLHFFLFFLHLFPPVDLHVLKSVSQPALQSAKTMTHGGGEATGAEGEGGGEATGEGGGGDATGTGEGGEGDATGTGGGGEGDATGTGEGGGGDASNTVCVTYRAAAAGCRDQSRTDAKAPVGE